MQPQRGFDFAAANTEPTLEAVVHNGPVQRRMVLSELSKVAVVELRSHPEFIGDVCGHIDSKVSECAAALTAVHRQPIINIRVHKPLRCKPVYVHVAAKELKVLCL